MALVVRTLSDRLVDLVRDRILTGSVPTGEAIRQDALAGELGVSKIPLREALARLTRDGLLDAQANRGFFVRAMSASEAEEIYALRLKIEPDAVVAGARGATDADRALAAAALAALDAEAAARGPAVGALNRAFHLALVRPGAGALTCDMVERLQVLAERYVRKHLEPGGRDARAHGEHQALLDAWIAADAARLHAMSARHIAATLEDLRAEIATAG